MVSTTATGWYFYGITRSGALAQTSEAAALQLLEFSGLAAVVKPVLLADFSAAVLQERFQTAAALEDMVRSHNQVVEAVHAQKPILPAKFGMVYASADDVVSALEPAHDALLDQLNRLDGCDEWAVHIYADRDAVRTRISSLDPHIRQLRDERAAARPGRAFFLDRQLEHEVEKATDQELVTIAQVAFDWVADCAVAGQMSPVGPAEDPALTEILRASFLVSRDGAEQFEKRVRSSADASVGVYCEYSGPWPAYSFASHEEAE
jgi:hypothetical protein